MDTITGTDHVRGPNRGMTAGEDDQTVACMGDPLQETTATMGGTNYKCNQENDSR